MIEVEEKNMYVGGIYRIADEKNPYYGYRDIIRISLNENGYFEHRSMLNDGLVYNYCGEGFNRRILWNPNVKGNDRPTLRLYPLYIDILEFFRRNGFKGIGTIKDKNEHTINIYEHIESGLVLQFNRHQYPCVTVQYENGSVIQCYALHDLCACFEMLGYGELKIFEMRNSFFSD